MKNTLLKLSRKKINSKVIIGLFALVICGFGFYFISNLETVTETIDIGMSNKARRNPKLAAEFFMKQSGISAEGLSDFALLDNLPPVDHVIIITGQRQSLSQYKYNRLQTWVENGGTLILTVQTLFDEKKESSGDLFLDRLGVRQYLTDQSKDETTANPDEETDAETETEKGTEIEKKSEKDTDSEKTPEEELEKMRQTIKDVLYNPKVPDCKENVDPALLSKINFDGITPPLTINFSTNFYMRDVSETATAIEGSQFGAHIIQYQQEKGVITVLTDDWIWDNDSIHCYDHAYLLWLLTQGNKKIWFLYKTDSPSFIELLIKNNHILVLSSLLLLFLFVLKHSQRFGPIIETTHFQRRHLKEHIDASGMYYWRHNQGQNLLTGLRKEIKRKMALYHPEVLDLPKAQMLNYLSEINTISVKEIDQALHHDGSAQINWTLFSTRLTGISSLKLFSAKKTRKIPHKVLIKEKEFSDMVKTLQHIMENL